MEPFIQLTYSEQCPQKSSQLTETSLIDKRKVPEHFWLDLLERKCLEGLGEVSESLLKDDSLTPADFLDDRNAFLDISTSQQNLTSCNDCLSSPKTMDCNEFKTPRTSRYMHKISETPCLFSQDESINHTPTSSLKSQPTCHGESTYKPVHTSPGSTSRVLCTQWLFPCTEVQGIGLEEEQGHRSFSRNNGPRKLVAILLVSGRQR
ncbi:hypothetical protein OS493_021462 [Desmophyllum pertusum]|uniref:Uncharacterized protein n=1 Tax=Desmophyllum pertusum TaxID=174260 RepID=A0A9W9Z0E2_9CNID|nr:hypothetical protein OS493_021462 [Desmophyllum pertusum]